MTVSFQLSDKRGDAILVVKAEGPGAEIDAIYAAFGGAVQDAGLEVALTAFGQGTVQAVTAAQPLVQPQAPIYAIQQPAQQAQWGQPPVPPMPAAAQPQAVGAPPVCQHGPKQYKSGESAKGKWAFWGCTARSEDPTKCEKEWVR